MLQLCGSLLLVHAALRLQAAHAGRAEQHTHVASLRTSQRCACGRGQNVTVCPFRVVDEINQGMDQANERRVFTQLSEAACEPGTPQCFLLTPKLLPQLSFTPQCTVLQILNGPTLAGVPGNDFSTARALQQNPVRG